jgi:hypothetical protein
MEPYKMEPGVATLTVRAARKQIAKIKGEIAELRIRIAGCVRFIKGNKQEFEFKDLLQQYRSKVDKLIKLKTAVMEINIKKDNYSRILELAETSAEIAFLKELNLKAGVEHLGFRDQSVEYDRQWTEVERDQQLKLLQDKVDCLTELLDGFNSTMKINI